MSLNDNDTIQPETNDSEIQSNAINENLDDDRVNNESPKTENNTSNQETTEPQHNTAPDKSTPESGAYLVCKGAVCKCDAGSLPFVKLQITSHSKYYVNDMQGAEKLVATVADNTFPSGGFGSCSNNSGHACCYAPSNPWVIKAGEEHPVVGSELKILTTNGELKCEAKKGKIKILTSGQMQTVSESDVDDYTVDLSSSLNCLAEEQDIKEKEDKTKYVAPGIDHICLADFKSKPIQNKNIIVRCNEKLKFKAVTTPPKDRTKTADPDLINWCVWEQEIEQKTKPTLTDENMQVFSYYGEEFALIFNKEGKYSIEAFGTDPKERKKVYDDCTLTFTTITENKITDIVFPKETLLRKTTVAFVVKTILEPNADELAALTIRIADSENNELHVTTGKVTTNYPFDNAGNYTIEAYYSYEPDNRLTKKLDVYNNNLLDKLEPNISKARIGEKIAFSVSLQNSASDDFDKIKWDIISPAGSKINNGEKTGKTSPPVHFISLGNYKIIASYKEGWMSSSKSVTHTVEGIQNKIKRLECNLKEDTLQQYSCYAGQEVKITAAMIMEYKAPLSAKVTDFPLKWDLQEPPSITNELNSNKIGRSLKKIDSPLASPLDRKPYYSFTPDRAGKYTLSVQHGNQAKQSIAITVNKSKIITWMFTDANKNYREYSGWKQQTYIYIQTKGWENREVSLALWFDRKKGEKPTERFVRLNIKELKNKQKVSEAGELFISIGANSDLWTLMQQQEYSGNASLFFTVYDLVTDCENKLDAVYNEEGPRNKHYYPQQVEQTYTYIPQKVQASGYFADAQGNILKRIISYKDTAYLIINIANGREENIENYKFTYHIIENKKNTNDKPIEVNDFEIDKNGNYKKTLPLSGLYGEGTHKDEIGANYKPRLFYFRVYRENKNSSWFKNKTDLLTYPPDYGHGKNNDDYLNINIEKQTSAEDIKKEREFNEEMGIGFNNKTIPGLQVVSLQKKPFNYNYIFGREKTDQEIADEKNREANRNNKKALPDDKSTFGKNYFLQLKVAKETILNKSLEKIAPVIIGTSTTHEKSHIPGNCYCNKDFTVDEVKSLVKAIKGKETIWTGGQGVDGFEECKIDDKTFEGLTKELNKAFKKHGINKCIQKIAILAETSIETGFFTCSEELKSRYASSKYLYKGRGMIQLTGSRDSNGNDIPGAYKRYKINNSIQEDIITHPNLVGEKLHLTIDSGCWFFNERKCPEWKHPTRKRNDESNEQFKKRQDAYKWKREYFGEAVSEQMSLNDIAKLMDQDEEKYFFLISKLCHGYLQYETDEKPTSLNYEKRWNNFQKIKTWFRYDKNRCNNSQTNTEAITGMPPWMVIAWQEYNKYKDYSHKESPLKERIPVYFKNTVYKNGTYQDNWCAAFVTWCLNKGSVNYPAPSAWGAVRARAFGKQGQASDHYWENGKVSEKYGYGAIAQIKWSTGGEHVAFIIGKTTDGRIALLGGNQTKRVNKVKVGRSITKSAASTSEIVSVMYPKLYEIDEKLYELSSENITDKLTSENTRK